MKITVVGTGYVGLVTGACLADMGNQILCLDVDAAKVRALNAVMREGHLPIYEPGLEAVVKRNCEAGRLSFSTDVAASVAHGVLQLIAVGTPPSEDGSADLQHVLAAARAIGQHMHEYRVIVNKSTVPVGTADKVTEVVSNALKERNEKIPFGVVSNPEFLKEGAAVEDFMRPDRIIVGSEDERATALLRELYAPFQRNHDRLMLMGVRSAELAKYAANAMLATRISFMNELANLAESLGADIEEVRRAIGADPRIGTHFLYAGAGFGGSCFPKDVKALQRIGAEAGRPLRVMAAVEQANEAQKHVLGDKIKARFGKDLKGKRFAVWGLAFKPNTDDMREAPSLVLIADLIAAGATIAAYDPVAGDQARRICAGNRNIEIKNTSNETLKDSDALAIVTEWAEFRAPDFAALKTLLKMPAIFDGRNLYDPAMVRSLGFEYFPVGRRKPGP
jgi:UDPglucose 6-dehydrogenase